MPYDFDAAVQAWTRVPVDDLGYFATDQMLLWSQEQLRQTITLARAIRWSPKGWRNRNNSLLRFMGLEPGNPQVTRKTVIDFGCGFGLDAMQFALAGNRVYLADISMYTLLLARQVLHMAALDSSVQGLCLVTEESPFFDEIRFDLFWSMGVLHHTPMAGAILQRACSLLNPDGECRIVLYSDKRWTQMTGEPCPPIDADVIQHPKFSEYVRKCDSVGSYIDWYSREKIERLVRDFARITACEYLGNGQLLGVILVKKDM